MDKRLKIITIACFISLSSFGQSSSDSNDDAIAQKKFVKVNLADIKYNKKAISHFGFGKTTYSDNYREKTTVFALSYATNRWWVNKYLAGGWFYEIAPTSEGGYGIGPQLTGFLDFDAIILPYVSYAMGFGYDVTNSQANLDEKSRIYAPMIFKAGSYIFLQKNKGFGLFFEINLNFTDDSWPVYRVGVAWSKLKRSAK